MNDQTPVLTKREAIKRGVLVLKEMSRVGASAKLMIAEIAIDDRLIPEDPKVVAQLVVSIREARQTTPILVRRSDAGYSLVDGLNRLVALKQLGETEVLATVLDVITDQEAKACEAISNSHRRQKLSALDRALTDVAFVQYVAQKVPQNAAPRGGKQPKEKFYAKTARELGVSPEQIARSCKIAKIVPPVQRAIRNNGQEDKQSLLLEVARSGDDYTAQIYTLTRLMNKVPEAAEQAWTNRLPPPADLSNDTAPAIAGAAPDHREVVSRGGGAGTSGTVIRNMPRADEAGQTNRLAPAHCTTSKQSAPASVTDGKRETGADQLGDEVEDRQGSNAEAVMQIQLNIPPAPRAGLARLADGATIRILGVVRAPLGLIPSIEVQEIVEIT